MDHPPPLEHVFVVEDPEDPNPQGLARWYLVHPGDAMEVPLAPLAVQDWMVEPRKNADGSWSFIVDSESKHVECKPRFASTWLGSRRAKPVTDTFRLNMIEESLGQ